MGVEKYFAGIVMILVALIAFSSLYYDSLSASSKTTNTPYAQALNQTNMYYSGLANQTDIAKNEVLKSGTSGGISQDPLTIITLSGESVAFTVIALISSLGIFYSISGIMGQILPVAAIFIGLGILYVAIMFVLSLLKAIRLGDTSG